MTRVVALGIVHGRDVYIEFYCQNCGKKISTTLTETDTEIVCPHCSFHNLIAEKGDRHPNVNA